VYRIEGPDSIHETAVGRNFGRQGPHLLGKPTLLGLYGHRQGLGLRAEAWLEPAHGLELPSERVKPGRLRLPGSNLPVNGQDQF
jgi:hypothetical protein